jgi:3-oxoisoapionate kinase
VSDTSPMSELPPGLLLAYYGDDFTGSTDTMEVMTFNGLPTVLFVEPPTRERLAQFADRRAIGIAGTARSETPEWMDEHLPGVFAQLAGLGAPILQYKVCSTFDSSPTVGSIGRALDIGLKTRPSPWSPMIVAAPALRRYQAFANLFATVEGTAYRLDRHPTMSRHPVTPMTEADLRLHLNAQTGEVIGLVDLLDLKAGRGQARVTALRDAGARVILIDVIDHETLIEAGRLVWEMRGDGVFTASSSGLQYALTAYWRSRGLIGDAPAIAPLPPAERVVAVSGSCSPVTEGQIDWSLEHGFSGIRLDVFRILDPASRQAEVGDAVERSVDALSAGKSPLVYSAKGPQDETIARLSAEARQRGEDAAAAQSAIGSALGDVLGAVLRKGGLKRAIVAGGDTSGRATAALGVYALEAAVPIAPGSPLCFAAAADPAFDGLEIALKGGQVGGPDYFAQVRNGGAPLTTPTTTAINGSSTP